MCRIRERPNGSYTDLGSGILEHAENDLDSRLDRQADEISGGSQIESLHC